MSNKLFISTVSGIYLFALAVSGFAKIDSVKAQSIPLTYVLSGTIRVLSSPLSNVKVILYKGKFGNRRITDTKTDVNGQYTFSVSEADYYMIKPAGSYKFKPEYISIFVNGSKQNLDFSATYFLPKLINR